MGGQGVDPGLEFPLRQRQQHPAHRHDAGLALRQGRFAHLHWPHLLRFRERHPHHHAGREQHHAEVCGFRGQYGIVPWQQRTHAVTGLLRWHGAHGHNRHLHRNRERPGWRYARLLLAAFRRYQRSHRLAQCEHDHPHLQHRRKLHRELHRLRYERRHLHSNQAHHRGQWQQPLHHQWPGDHGWSGPAKRHDDRQQCEWRDHRQ